jgi:tight adherence protein B
LKSLTSKQINKSPIACKTLKMPKVPNEDESLVDYDLYVLGVKERAFYICIAAAAIYVTAFIFYRSHFISTLLLPLAFLYPRMKIKDIIKRRKNELNIQFKDLLYSLSSSISAGRSVESAFREAIKDLSILYPNPETAILKEIRIIIRKLELNEPIESAIYDFAGRAHLEDIENFADVFYICKRTGGNIIRVISNSTNIISDKIEIRQEIDTMLAEKKFEQKVLNMLPIFIIVLLSVSASDYMRPVFNTAAGRIIMSISILLFAGAYFISKKIMDIKV